MDEMIVDYVIREFENVVIVRSHRSNGSGVQNPSIGTRCLQGTLAFGFDFVAVLQHPMSISDFERFSIGTAYRESNGLRFSESVTD